LIKVTEKAVKKFKELLQDKKTTSNSIRLFIQGFG